jgi:CheY-like chemotaxis protein
MILCQMLASEGRVVLSVGLPLDPERPASQARILVVEDDVLVSRAISRVLARLGWEVIAAPSCLAARALACHFDLGVFELELIDGSGIELAQAMLDAGRVDFAVFFTAELEARALGPARRVGPLVKKSEGVEALVPVVVGHIDSAGGRSSGIRLTAGEAPIAAQPAKSAG